MRYLFLCYYFLKIVFFLLVDYIAAVYAFSDINDRQVEGVFHSMETIWKVVV